MPYLARVVAEGLGGALEGTRDLVGDGALREVSDQLGIADIAVRLHDGMQAPAVVVVGEPITTPDRSRGWASRAASSPGRA